MNFVRTILTFVWCLSESVRFVTFKNIWKLIFDIFVIIFWTVVVVVKVLIRKMDVYILNENDFVVFAKDALILEFRNIEKRILDALLILFDILEISIEYTYTLQHVV